MLSFLICCAKTSGPNPAIDQIVNFGALRLNEDLTAQPTPYTADVMLRPDVIPTPEYRFNFSPDASNEYDFAESLQGLFIEQADTLLVHFSDRISVDEFLRNLMWRNLLDPYRHEWLNGNLMFNLFNVVRIGTKLYPHIMKPGKTFALNDICKVNNIVVSGDGVTSNLQKLEKLMKFISTKLPKYFKQCISLCNKAYCRGLLANKEPIRLLDPHTDEDRIVMPIGVGTNPNQYICFDLAYSFRDCIDQIHSCRSMSDLSQLGVVSVALNKQPFILPLPEPLSNHQVSDVALIRQDKIVLNYASLVLKGHNDQLSPSDAYFQLYDHLPTKRESDIRAWLRQINETHNRYNLLSFCVFAVSDRLPRPEIYVDLLIRLRWNFFRKTLFKTRAYRQVELLEYRNYLSQCYDGVFRGRSVSNIQREVDKNLQASPNDPFFLSLKLHLQSMQNYWSRLNAYCNIQEEAARNEYGQFPVISKVLYEKHIVHAA